MHKRTLLSPAKLNLSLRITGRRGDGYHLIESMFAPIALFDRLDVLFSRSPGAVEVISESPETPSGPSNLVFRAAEVMRHHIGHSFSLKVHLQKRIPAGSGLGGGSSNAATILRFLNNALDSPCERTTLAALGMEVGADVPFFLQGRPAIVRGVGEIVEPLRFPLDACLVVGWPRVTLSTAAVYTRADRIAQADASLTTIVPPSNIADFVGGRRPLEGPFVNDLEEAAAQICPAVRQLKREMLSLGAQGASMTGSGSAVFGVCPDAESAERIAAALHRKGFWACSTRTLEASQAES